MKKTLIFILLGLILAAGCAKKAPSAPADNTPVSSKTPTATWTITGTGTQTATFTNTATITCTPTHTQTHTATPTSTATVTNTPFSLILRQGDNSYAGTTDNLIDKAIPNKNFGGSSFFVLSASSGNPKRMLVKYDLAGQFAVTNTAVGAEFVLVTNNSNGTAAFGMTPYNLTHYWAEGICSGIGCDGYSSWNNYDAAMSLTWVSPWTTPGGDFDPAPAGPSSMIIPTGTLGQEYTFRLNESVINGWIQNAADNNGIILKMDDESASSGFITPYTKHIVTISYRPRLTIYYY